MHSSLLRIILGRYGTKQFYRSYKRLLWPVETSTLLQERNYSKKDTFLNGSSAQYVEDMFNAWMKDPSSVHASWDSYFRSSTQGRPGYQRPPSLALPGKNEIPISAISNQGARPPPPPMVAAPAAPKPSSGAPQDNIGEHTNVLAIIRNYQLRGHMVAQLDPLGIMYEDHITTISDRLGRAPAEVIRQHHLDESAMNKVFQLPSTTFIGGADKALPLKEILHRLELTYCRHIGAEFMFIPSMEECQWIRKRLETPGVTAVTKEEKVTLFKRIARAHGLEAFFSKKYPSEKRFGLEGGEALIPSMKTVIDKSSELGVESVIICMAHRGRLNVLANVCRKPLVHIFTQFAGLEPADEGSGDVKYHLGVSIKRINRATNKPINLSIVANPSHLETADTVALGKARAEQFYNGDHNGTKTVAFLIHGDAAFSGQGICYEAIHLSNLPAYTTHGTIHFVVNNQVGFTTDPRFSRSSPYCTDLARVVNAPIFHVNADDPESVLHVSKIAAEWRATYRKDVVIDLVCYRRHGHNELDEPMFTQPLMYQRIRKIKPLVEKYAEALIKEGVITAEEVKNIRGEYEKICEQEFANAAKETHIKFSDWIDSPWKGFFKGKDPLKIMPTGVPESTLATICKKYSTPPPDFVIHKGIERILRGRADLVSKRMADWAIGEACAFTSLLKDGIHVRLSGEDVERGTFSHRHHVLHHQEKDKVTYRILDNTFPNQAYYSVCNSSLCEYGVLGFELGYSMTNPNALVMWEAQFGDFANTAQAVIDTMIASGQTKWARQAGLVMMLPHGMEGQGPEHSSARLERYLQLCSEEPDVFPAIDKDFPVRQLSEINWIVANCTTPANLFHILRRQIAMPFRKPLALMTPKSLMRHPEARSSFDDMLEGTEFQRIIPDKGPASKNPTAVKKLIFCTGKVYYDLSAKLKEKKVDDKIALTRIEQICPFPFDLVKKECDKYPNAQIVWCQEEHKNQGAWSYVQPRFEVTLKKEVEIAYIGRPVSASTATGSKPQYAREFNNFTTEATTLPK